MNKNLEARLRLRVRRVVESVLREEPLNPMFDPKDVSASGAMNKSKDFKTLPVVAVKPVKVATDTTVSIDKDFVTIDRAGNEVTLSRKSAKKLADYLIRVLGKV